MKKSVKLSKKNVKIINKVEKRKEDVDYMIINRVAMKALKVVATNGDKKALDILVYFKSYKMDDFEDLVQAVALASMENGYIMNSKIIISKGVGRSILNFLSIKNGIKNKKSVKKHKNTASQF